MVDCIPWQKYKNVFIHPNFFVEKCIFTIVYRELWQTR